MAGAPVTFVEIDRVAGLEGLHRLGEISFGCLQKKMHMVGQKAVREKLNSLLLAVKRELFQVPPSVLVVPKNSLTVVASTNDVIDGSRIFDPNRSGHEGKLPHHPSHYNSIHLYKPDPDLSRREKKVPHTFSFLGKLKDTFPGLLGKTRTGIKNKES